MDLERIKWEERTPVRRLDQLEIQKDDETLDQDSKARRAVMNLRNIQALELTWPDEN